MFNLSAVLIPLCIVKQCRSSSLGGQITYRELYVFGIRLAYWTCD